MKRNSLFTKAIALLVCAIMLIGYLPSIALPVAANDFESDIDVVETTEAPTEAPGAESNPIALVFEDNGEGALVAYTEDIPAGATVYYSIRNLTGDVVFTGAESFSVSYNGTTYDAVDWEAIVPIVSDTYNHAVVGITNNTDAAAAITAMYFLPEGTIENPQDLWEGDNSVTLEAGSQGWYYDYVGYSDGYLTITVSGDSWQYVVNNETTYEYGDTHTSADETLVASETLEYHAGDKVVVFVNTFNPADAWNAPAGSVNVNISFVPGFGTEESPYQLTELENTITVPAGATVWYQGWFNGLEMTVIGDDYTVIYNGEENVDVDHMTVTAANPRMPVTFAVTNNGDADAEYQVNFTYPAGTAENPAVAVLGDNEVVFEEAPTAEYVWQYTAEKDGELNITVSSDSGNWQYTVTNMTSYVYGDTQWSDSDPVVNPTVLEVAAGDVIQIKVITYDPANMWAAPAGTITTNLAYACEHANTTTTNTATCTEAGVETVVCDDCGETISTTDVAALGHDYTGENGACVRCGEYQIDSKLKFYSVGIAFAEFIGVQSMVMNSAVKNYESYTVEVVHKLSDGTEQVVVLDPMQYSSYAVFDMQMVPYQMCDELVLNIYAVKGGVTYQSADVVTSVKQLAMEKIASYYTAGNTDACKILVDMLNYGSEAQKLFGDANSPDPTADLGDYASLGTSVAPTIEGTVTSTGSGISVIANSLSLGSKVEVQFMFRTKDVKGCELRYTIDGQDTVIIPADEFTAYGSTYLYTLFAMKPADFRKNITIGVYNSTSGEAVSAIYSASVEAYAAQFLAKGQYTDLLPDMIAYGDSVAAMFG